MDAASPIPAMTGTPRRWIRCCASVGLRPIDEATRDRLRIGVRLAFKRAAAPLIWAIGIAAAGLLTASCSASISDTVLIVFVLCQGVAGVLLLVSLAFLGEAFLLQHERKQILKNPFIERFEIPPALAIWMEQEQEGGCDYTVDIPLDAVEVFAGDGTNTAEEFRAGRTRERPKVWLGVLPLQFDSAAR
ncbi:MAG: hypothetical protein QM783_19650 [Phycisphaerales bacterium]